MYNKVKESSAWNLSEEEAKRLAYLLKQRDKFYTLCAVGKLKYLKFYFAVVRNIYGIYRPILHEENVRAKLDRRFKKIEEMLVNGEYTWKTFRRLSNLDNDVQYWRQKKGLGFLTQEHGGAEDDMIPGEE